MTNRSNNITPIPANNSPADPYLGGCFKNYTPEACARAGSLATLAIVTALVCTIKIIALHRRKKRAHANHYVVFYAALIECLLFAVHWLVEYDARIVFACEWLNAIEILAVLHFYAALAVAMVYQDKSKLKRFAFPFIVVLALYFTSVMIYAIVHVQKDSVECTAHAWLLFSVSDFLLVQLFALVALYINRVLNSVMTLEDFKRRQKRHVISLVIVFEVAILLSIVIDIVDKVSYRTDKEFTCWSFFIKSQTGFTIYYIVFRIVKYFMPIWAMCVVFHLGMMKPSKLSSSSSSSSSTSSLSTSVSRTNIDIPFAASGKRNTRAARIPYVSHFTNQRHSSYNINSGGGGGSSGSPSIPV